jgi:methylated-DNA-protein-cysteine methyltransferase-like protein
MAASEPSFSNRVKQLIKEIPRGRVATYGQIAACAGNHRASRQVAWLLNSSSRKEKLPWHRVINSRGGISLPTGGGFEEQKKLLEAEAVIVDEKGRVNLNKYLWNPGAIPEASLRDSAPRSHRAT